MEKTVWELLEQGKQQVEKLRELDRAQARIAYDMQRGLDLLIAAMEGHNERNETTKSETQKNRIPGQSCAVADDGENSSRGKKAQAQDSDRAPYSQGSPDRDCGKSHRCNSRPDALTCDHCGLTLDASNMSTVCICRTCADILAGLHDWRK